MPQDKPDQSHSLGNADSPVSADSFGTIGEDPDQVNDTIDASTIPASGNVESSELEAVNKVTSPKSLRSKLQTATSVFGRKVGIGGRRSKAIPNTVREDESKSVQGSKDAFNDLATFSDAKEIHEIPSVWFDDHKIRVLSTKHTDRVRAWTSWSKKDSGSRQYADVDDILSAALGGYTIATLVDKNATQHHADIESKVAVVREFSQESNKVLHSIGSRKPVCVPARSRLDELQDIVESLKAAITDFENIIKDRTVCIDDKRFQETGQFTVPSEYIQSVKDLIDTKEYDLSERYMNLDIVQRRTLATCDLATMVNPEAVKDYPTRKEIIKQLNDLRRDKFLICFSANRPGGSGMSDVGNTVHDKQSEVISRLIQPAISGFGEAMKGVKSFVVD